MNMIPDKYRDLLDRPVMVSLASLMSDGPPQVQPVWCSFDGGHILVNNAAVIKLGRNRRRCILLHVSTRAHSRMIR